ncbi:MAG: hypothetical protein KC478_14450, partial [Bacteriovoracaceae bacterium]|nr:hypothetical protein [Bacteriovoracaceae bacterium]
MGYRICYIGNDAKFCKDLKSEVRKITVSEVNFQQVGIDTSFDSGQCFVELYKELPDVIYIDLSFEPDKTLSLSKLLCRNNETRLKSLVLLHDHNVGHESLLRGVLSGARLNYYKNADMDEIVNHPLLLLDPKLEQNLEYASGLKINEFKFKQIMRIGYIADNHYRVETNCELDIGEIIELDTHPLEDEMPSNRFLPETFSDSDLYYNQRYSYNFKFTFLNDAFFLASEKSWLKYKIAGSRDRIKKLFEKASIYILDDIDKRTRTLLPIRQKIKDWIEKHKSNVEPKRLKVLVVDEKLEIFKEFLRDVDRFKHTINFQTKLTKDFYQIRRSRPHLILFHYNQFGNDKSVLG